MRADTARADGAGFRARALEDTVRATLDHAALVDGVGLTTEREAELLASWWSTPKR
jgi:hypothetical protein